jgi:uncharacterized protein YegP (UPF0339 family)
MNLIWRFHLDQNQQWRWQQLTVNRNVVAESRKGYKEHEGCVEDARRHGYDSAPSQTTPAKARLYVRARW